MVAADAAVVLHPARGRAERRPARRASAPGSSPRRSTGRWRAAASRSCGTRASGRPSAATSTTFEMTDLLFFAFAGKAGSTRSAAPDPSRLVPSSARTHVIRAVASRRERTLSGLWESARTPVIRAVASRRARRSSGPGWLGCGRCRQPGLRVAEPSTSTAVQPSAWAAFGPADRRLGPAHPGVSHDSASPITCGRAELVEPRSCIRARTRRAAHEVAFAPARGAPFVRSRRLDRVHLAARRADFGVRGTGPRASRRRSGRRGTRSATRAGRARASR